MAIDAILYDTQGQVLKSSQQLREARESKLTKREFSRKKAKPAFKRWGRWLAREIDAPGGVKCSLGHIVDLGEHIPSGYGETKVLYDVAEDIQVCCTVFALLTEDYKKILLGKFYHDMTDKEIILKTGISSVRYALDTAYESFTDMFHVEN